MDLDAVHADIGSLYRGRRWILAPDAAASATRGAAELRDYGASAIMVVAAMEGVGDLPEVDRIHYTRSTGNTLMEGFRSFYRSVEEPSPELVEAVDRFDPDGTAMVLGGGFSRKARLANRPVYGYRRPEWRSLEDKLVVDDLWRTAGVTSAPYSIVSVPDARDAHTELAGPDGTVWVADNREGWHGGGEYTRWVPGDEDIDATEAWFSRHADRVRVMPFLEGLPCSIHGFITRNGVAVMRPVELFVARDREQRRFVYCQAANFWSPPEWLHTQMREVARSVGHVIASDIGYLGGFGIDGVATPDGFLPTELNPRLSVGHGMQTRPLDIPLGHMEMMLLEGDLEIDAAELERTVYGETLTKRYGGVMILLDAEYPSADTLFRFTDDGAVATDVEDEADGSMALGPAASGSLVVVRPNPDRIPIGPSFTPRVLDLRNLARSLWDLDLPEVDAATNLTP